MGVVSSVTQCVRFLLPSTCRWDHALAAQSPDAAMPAGQHSYTVQQGRYILYEAV